MNTITYKDLFINFPTTLTEAQALLVQADTVIRFVPNADYYNDYLEETEQDTITLRIYEQSSGQAGEQVNTLDNGTTTAFSEEIATVTTTVTAVTLTRVVSKMIHLVNRVMPQLEGVVLVRFVGLHYNIVELKLLSYPKKFKIKANIQFI